MAYMRDSNSSRLDTFDPRRDIPGLTAWFHGDDLIGANGANVSYWPSRTSSFALNATSATKPTKLAAVKNGHSAARFGGAVQIFDVSTFGINGSVLSTGAYPLPTTQAFVFRVSTDFDLAASRVVLATGSQQVNLSVTGKALYCTAGTNSLINGPELADGQWHVAVVVLGVNGAAVYVDGYLTSCSGSIGSGTASGYRIGPGAGVAASTGTVDIGEVMTWNAALNMSQVHRVTQALATEWGVTAAGRQVAGLGVGTDTTDSGGINVRYWMPPTIDGTTPRPLVIFCHQSGGSEQIPTAYWAYPLVHAAIQEGWMVAASRAHGDNWGNDASLTDVQNLKTLINGINPVSQVILVGASMGGLDAALTVSKANLTNVVGAYLVDPVLDLSWAYTANSNAFQSSINTAYGVASYAAIPAGHDPMTQTTSTYTGIRWRISASTADTNVSKASNCDPFLTKVAAAPEASLNTHNASNHTVQGLGSDLVAFAKRCGFTTI